jgi:hypothetical protein
MVYMPAASDVHVNKMLTNILVGYRNSQFIADEIFPIVRVTKQTDIVPAMKQSSSFRDEATPLGEAGVAPRVGYEVDTTDTYRCERYGLAHAISDDRRANEDDPFDSDEAATMLLADRMMLRRERAFVSDFWSTSVWGTDKVGGTDFTKWSSYGSSNPIEDMREYVRTVRRAIGFKPNTLVLGDLTRDVLVDHPDVLERIVYTQTGIANEALLANLFDVERVLVGESVYTADDEGTAEASVSYTANWDDDALLLYVPPNPSLYTPSAGYTFVWNTGVGNGLQWMRKYRDNEAMSDVIEIRSYFDQKQVVSNAGLFVSDAVDTIS